MGDNVHKAPRDVMVNTAVKFLQNSKVRESPQEQQVAFLEKKGLTRDEIDLAFKHVGSSSPVQPYTPYPGGIYNHQALEPVSIWSRVREQWVNAIVVGGLGYVIYRFIQRYVIPLLWEDSTQKRLERLEQQHLQAERLLQETLAGVRELLSAVNETVKQQNDKIDKLLFYTNSPDYNLNEIKTGITSLKGLLLNRRQFPPTPLTTPLIPSWQRESPPGDRIGTSPVSPRSISPTESSPKESSSWVRVETSPTPPVNSHDVDVDVNHTSLDTSSENNGNVETPDEDNNEPY